MPLIAFLCSFFRHLKKDKKDERKISFGLILVSVMSCRSIKREKEKWVHTEYGNASELFISSCEGSSRMSRELLGNYFYSHNWTPN